MPTKRYESVRITAVQVRERPSWSAGEFTFALLARALSIITVTRIPYLMYRHGGVVFLIPTFVFTLLFAVPLYFLAIFLGQKSQRGFLNCWTKFVPLKGIGISWLILIVLENVAHQTFVTWVSYYLGHSFGPELYYTSCANEWNIMSCSNQYGSDANTTTSSPLDIEYTRPETDFFQRKMYRYPMIESPFKQMGGFNIFLMIAHCAGWVLIYICTIVGFRSLGKVLCVTATVSYLLAIALLARGLSLPGAFEGVKALFYPDIEQLFDFRTWYVAFLNTYYDVVPGLGVLVALGSYNRYQYNFLWAPFTIPFMQIVNGVLFGCIMFSFAGFMSHISGSDVATFITSDSVIKVVTETFPLLLSQVPNVRVWIVIAFFLLFFTLFDNQCLLFQSCVSAVKDEFNIGSCLDKLLAVGFLAINVSLGLLFVCGAGTYYLVIVTTFLFLITPYVLTAFLGVGITWIYGLRRIRQDLENMTGSGCCQYLFIPFWGILIPLLVIAAMAFAILDNMEESTPLRLDDYVYPVLGTVIGWLVAVLPVLPMLVYTGVRLLLAIVSGTPGKAFRPNYEHSEGMESIAFQSFNV